MYKRNSQPLNAKSCGCVFKNPPGRSAGAIIDAAGLKGTRAGGAEVSHKHANFIVAHPGCSAADVLALIRPIAGRVRDHAGVELETRSTGVGVGAWGGGSAGLGSAPFQPTTCRLQPTTMNVTVLYGGPSAEREVSLVSGRAVIAGLESMGHTVFGSDVSPTRPVGPGPARPTSCSPSCTARSARAASCRRSWRPGGLPFVGSGSRASRLGMDKADTKRAWEAAGLPTPAWLLATGNGLRRRRLHRRPRRPGRRQGAGQRVQPGRVRLHRPGRPPTAALAGLLSTHGRALVEQYIDGPELTVGLLEEEPLAPIRIVPKGAFFDHHAKYAATDTEHRFDTGLPAAVVEHCRDLARRANAVVGGRDLARVDVMLDADHRPYLLEINTLPGFTPKSLLPEAAAHAGVAFGPLVDRLVRRAHARGRHV